MDYTRAQSFLTKDGKISARKIRAATGSRKAARVGTKVSGYRKGEHKRRHHAFTALRQEVAATLKKGPPPPKVEEKT